jgi:hypothetical protein
MGTAKQSLWITPPRRSICGQLFAFGNAMREDARPLGRGVGRGWRLAAGGWRLAAGGWRLAAGGELTKDMVALFQYVLTY